jgi:hypothetical protein
MIGRGPPGSGTKYNGAAFMTASKEHGRTSAITAVLTLTTARSIGVPKTFQLVCGAPIVKVFAADMT